MNSYDAIASAFHRRIDTIVGAVDALAPGLQRAADAVADTALADRRLFVCASGADAGLARYGALMLRSAVNGLPSLPALAVVTEDHDGARLWRDVRTLSRDRDTLLYIDCSSGAERGRDAVEQALQRNLTPLLLSDEEELPAPAVALPLLAASDEERRELALMSLHTLQQLLLRALMGDT